MIASTRFSPSWVRETYCHTEQIGNGLYAGYRYEVNRKKDEENPGQMIVSGEVLPSFSYRELSKGEYEISIPDGTDLLIFSEKKLKPKHVFVNHGGKEITADFRQLGKDECPGMKQYSRYDVMYLLPYKNLYAYQRSNISVVAGNYHVVMK